MMKWTNDRTTVTDPKIEFRTEQLRHFYPIGFLSDQAWWAAVLELQPDTSIDQLLAMARENGLYDAILIPQYYDDEEKMAPDVRYIAVHVQRAFIEKVNQRDGELPVTGIELGAIVPESLLDLGGTYDPGPEIDVPDKTVVMAVIDSGIAFAHNLFRNQDDTTRVQAVWLMDSEANGSGMPQGRKISKDKIDTALAANTHCGLLDEDAFYREVGLIDFKRAGFKPASMRISHGTHIMGLAAGYHPQHAPANRPIVCVQLPTDLVMDVSGANIIGHLGHAISFIIRIARRFRYASAPDQRPPLVVNFSFGNYAGPHDSTGRIARALDHWFTPAAATSKCEHPQMCRLLLPAGNGNLARCHAAIRFRNGFTQATLDWRVQPGDRSASYVQLWMPWREAGSDTDIVSVTVEPPNGPESDPVGCAFWETRNLEVSTVGGKVTVGTVSFTKRGMPTDRGVIDICIFPTQSHDSNHVLAPSGVWKIRVTAQNIRAHETVQCWIARDETLPGFPVFGRQSYFDNECYVRFDNEGAPLPVDPSNDECIVRRAGTLSGFASTRYPAVLAGYVRSDLSLAGYSAAGPITPVRDTVVPVRDGPDAAAPSDDSPVLYGVISAGSRCGSMVAMSGTSVASPQAAHWLALKTGASGGPGDRKTIHDAGVNGHGVGSTLDPAPRTGGGKMELPPRFGANRRPD